jgi:hypothetical protein
MQVKLQQIRNGNFARVDLGSLSIWFSYQTAVGFQLEGTTPVVRENVWGPTTGRHLNEIDGGNKSGRISGADFEQRLRSILGQIEWVRPMDKEDQS